MKKRKAARKLRFLKIKEARKQLRIRLFKKNYQKDKDVKL